MPLFYDQMKRVVNVSANPKRIVSLVPSQTELLFELGLNEQIVGVTKFCIHPADKVKNIKKVGGTKQLNTERIDLIKPDLIIGNKEENEQSQIEQLSQHYPIWMSDIVDLASALNMIAEIGEITGKSEKASWLTAQITTNFDNLEPLPAKLNVLYLIWRKPYMAAGKHTFINDMLARCGFNNIIHQSRYPELSMAEIQLLDPDVILLSSEPYPFADQHINELKEIVPEARILLTDGELFSWYGSRLLHSPGYFRTLIKKLNTKE
ncbi:cobalamin-binding protein [Mucilaginibacter litoreus]|uniref:Cobalamin-binding protein n=1 Tax=Mucilaginibacter litoreus TaxID=1048221 RepID=A0ABW3ASK5_9SPHI